MIFDIFCFFVIIYYIHANFSKNNYTYIFSKCYIIFGYVSNIISLLCTILMIVDSIFIIINLKNEKREVFSYDKKKLIMVKEIKCVITKEKLLIIAIILLLNIIFWMLIFIFWCFILFIIKREYKNYLRYKINKKEKSLDSTYNYDNITFPFSEFTQTKDFLNKNNIKKLKINNNNSVKSKKKNVIEKGQNYTQKKEERKKFNDLIYHSLKLDLKVLDLNDNYTYIDKSINSK